jgi:hypothetical protein
MNADSKSDKWLWTGGFLVILLTVAAHVHGLQGQFVEWDDTNHITQNVAIRGLRPENLRAMFTEYIAKLYVPLTWLSFAIDYQIWGRDPFGYHFTNLLLHLANTALVLMLVSRLLRDRYEHASVVALLTAAFFGVHPLRVESVAWATERKDVLFVFFFLLGLPAYLRWTTEGKRSAYWACFGCFVASALAKPAAVTFPVVLLLLDSFRARRFALKEKIPFFIVTVIIGAVNFVAQASGKGETVAGAEVIPLWARPGLIGYCSLFYVKKFFWPLHLSAIYPTFDEMGWTPWTALGYLLGFALITAAIVGLRRRLPALLPSWVFYLITLSPTIGLLPVGIHVVADRFSYLPLLGLALSISLGIVCVSLKAPPLVRLAAGVCVAVVLVVLTLLSAQRTADWANTETLFQSALRENPRCLPAHVNLTVWYTSHKQFDKAIAHGRAALAIAPNGLPGRKNLAYALINAGRQREAIDVLRVLAEHNVDDPDVWRALAECFEAVGDQPNANAAKEHLRKLTSST